MIYAGVVMRCLGRRSKAGFFLFLFCFLFFCSQTYAQTSDPLINLSCEAETDLLLRASEAANGSRPLAKLQLEMEIVRDRSFPELSHKIVRTKNFQSPSDYFQTRFSLSRFLLWRRMHYFVEMNPKLAVNAPPPEAVCAILAHELTHIVYMSRGNRLHLFSLIRFVSGKYTARFERSADLEAIQRGYGEGLASYREWVYKNIPANAVARKRRNYFSPEEIAAILRISATRYEALEYWKKHVPLNLEQIQDAEHVFPNKQEN